MLWRAARMDGSMIRMCMIKLCEYNEQFFKCYIVLIAICRQLQINWQVTEHPWGKQMLSVFSHPCYVSFYPAIFLGTMIVERRWSRYTELILVFSSLCTSQYKCIWMRAVLCRGHIACEVSHFTMCIIPTEKRFFMPPSDISDSG